MLRKVLVACLVLLLTTFAAAQMEMRGTLSQIQEVNPVSQEPVVSLKTATPEQLELRGDQLRDIKDYLDALDYYEAAIKKHPTAILHNKIGMTYLSMGNLGKAEKSMKRAVKTDKDYAEAYNNLGVIYYLKKKWGPAEKNYKKALALQESASFHSNLGTVYMERKQYDKGMVEYTRAYQLDPGIFERTSRTGVSARMSSPDDRARYYYFLAKLFAANGKLDDSLQYLRRAMEDGYSGIDSVYKDAEFANLRKDQRFTELMAQRPAAIPQ